MAERSSLDEADQPSPCPYLFLLKRGRNRDTEKHDFRSVLFHPMLSNANRLRAMLNTQNNTRI